MNVFVEWSSKASGGIAVRPVSAGNRIVLKLFWDKSPLTCENFATLCVNGGNSLSDKNGQKIKPALVRSSGKSLTYRGSNVHRIVPGFIMQGGDFVFGHCFALPFFVILIPFVMDNLAFLVKNNLVLFLVERRHFEQHFAIFFYLKK